MHPDRSHCRFRRTITESSLSTSIPNCSPIHRHSTESAVCWATPLTTKVWLATSAPPSPPARKLMSNEVVGIRPVFSTETVSMTDSSRHSTRQVCMSPGSKFARQLAGPNSVPPARKLFQLSQFSKGAAGMLLSEFTLVMW